MIYEKPKKEIFASDAKDGEIVEFPNVKRGWGVTENLGFIPPMEYFNAAFNRVDKSLAYQLQRGIGEWDKDMEYPIGAVVSLNGIIYIAKSQNTNKSPANEAEVWDAVVTKKWSDNKFALKDDLPSLATEEKVGITKLKNAITAKQEDAAVTEKAVAEAIEANKGLGIDQTWQDMKSQRQNGVIYTNTTGRAIMILVSEQQSSSSQTCELEINGKRVLKNVSYGTADGCLISALIPAGATYKVIYKNYPPLEWHELR
ncbi:hypothetical protein [Campylobacter concisus]|uniref:hypothetical protein n=1 Tax=Campylobacter concisus TaxID=199 RepID=UPI00122CEE54|nr:hypothetical protein [Campylobacter concisus]